MNLDPSKFDLSTETLIELATIYGLKVLSAVAIFIFGKWIAGMLIGVAQKVMRKSKVEETLVAFAGNILYALAMTFIVIAAMSQLGINTTSLAAVLAAAGLAIGLALQGSLSNFASGVLIIMFRPFKINDVVEAAGQLGTVEDISIFTTSMVTLDNKQVIIPNGSITSNNIINYSTKPERRVDLTVGVSYGDDLRKVKAVLEDVVAKDDRVLKSPAVQIAVSEMADNSVNLVVRPWVKNADYWNVYFSLTEAIKLRFDEEGISIPFPQRDLHLVSGFPEASKN